MKTLVLAAGLGLAACTGPAVKAQDSQAEEDTPNDGLSKIAERDLRELKALLPGVYSNEEQVYFQDNLELPESKHLPRLRLTITPEGDDFITKTYDAKTEQTTESKLSFRIEDGQIKSVETRAGQPKCNRGFTRNFEQFRGVGCGSAVTVSPTGFIFGHPEKPFYMRRARRFKCWVSPQKTNGEYSFYNDVTLHDQGGRAWIEGTADHPRIGLKMRNVVWPSGTNRHSLVLYAYRGDDDDKAVSYVWTDPSTERIALNLRWLQASCTKGDAAYQPNINLKTGAGSGK